MNEQNFIQLCETFASVDLFGPQPPPPPWGDGTPTIPDARSAIEAGRAAIPLSYDAAFIDPVAQQLARVIQAGDQVVETMAGAVYQHGNYPLAQPLRRFLAVVSNLYRSFLDRQKRAAADFPLRQTLPPLATFKYLGDFGPFTIPVDMVADLVGGSVGVVSLPASYSEHPVLWASLAHETGGHDVVHADQGLLEELQGGLSRVLKNTSVSNLRQRDLVALWAYWMDETVADVYGLLNIGPTFGSNLAAFFAALRSKPAAGGFSIPKISMRSVSSPQSPELDVHPTDILRLHIAIGVVESSGSLSLQKRKGYLSDLKQLATLCASGSTIQLGGYMVGNDGNPTVIDTSVPLSEMQEAARRVGQYVATAKLASLGGHAIQEIETWDDADEERAEAVRAALAVGQPIATLGDDAQLLAGSMMHLLNVPGAYPAVTAALSAGLDRSFATDPIWNAVSAEPIFQRQSPPQPAGKRTVEGVARQRSRSRRRAA